MTRRHSEKPADESASLAPATETTVEPLLLTQADVARLLNLTVWQVYGLHRMGRLRGKKIGRVLRWRRADVERFVAEL